MNEAKVNNSKLGERKSRDHHVASLTQEKLLAQRQFP